jgi:hypothetical protein
MAKMFKIGDRVAWSSQAHGTWQKKVGVVERVCPPHHSPTDIIPNCGGWREHESYVIRVGARAGVKGKLYWPIASKLRKA